MKAGTYKVTAYCKCGASLVGSGAGDLAAVAELQEAFWTIHTGDEHGPATQRQAATARRREERALIDRYRK